MLRLFKTCIYKAHRSEKRGVLWLAIKLFLILMSLNFYKEYLFGFETLDFATSGIVSMHEQLVTLQRGKGNLKSHQTPLK